MSYEQSNVGLGMVPHRKGCRCDECEIDRLKARLAHEQATNANLLRALAEAESRQTCEGTQPYVCHALATARARLAEAERERGAVSVAAGAHQLA